MPDFRFEYFVSGQTGMSAETREKAAGILEAGLRAANPGVEDVDVVAVVKMIPVDESAEEAVL